MKKRIGHGIVGRRVTWTDGRGEWVVRAVVGSCVRISRARGGMSFLTPRATVKFMRGKYEVKRQPGEVVI